jgi:GT2 family glycosyltransferase
VQRECRISIITINYNGLNDTCELIDSIPKSDDIEIVVVDNASSTDEASILEARYPEIIVVRSNKNLGFAGGNNLGIKEAKGEYILLINNDTYFKEFNIENLIKRLDSSDKIGIVCPKLRFAWGNNPIQFAGYTPLSCITLRNKAIGFGEEDKGQYDTAHPTPYAHGAAMLIKREAIEKVGLMPECFFLYYEEIDWSMMFTRAGYEIWYDPCCTVYHKESQTTGQQSPLRTYYITRNRLLFVKRNNSNATRYLSYLYLICLVASRDILKHLFQHRFDLAKATFKGVHDFLSLNSKFL